MPGVEEEEDIPDIEALDDDPPPERVAGPSGKEYSDVSLNLWRVSDSPRKHFIRLVEWPAFDQLILLTILCNCTTMAWESPLDPCCTWKADFIDVRSSLCSSLPDSGGLSQKDMLCVPSWLSAPCECMPGKRQRLSPCPDLARRAAGVRVGLPVHLHV
jgi:hypothetical protein